MTNPYLRLKAGFRDLVDAAGGNARAARVSRAAGSMLSRYGAIHEQTQCPIDIVADLEQETNDPIVTRILADLAGYVLVPKTAAPATSETILGHLSDVHAATSDLQAELIRDAADGAIDDEEAARIEARCDAAEQQIAELRADVSRRRTATPLRAVK